MTKKELQRLSREQLIILLQIILNKIGEKKTLPGLPIPKHIVVHHGGGDWDFAQVNNHHRRKWGFRSSLGYYAGYTYFIEFSGKLYQARADNEEGAHCVEPGRKHYWNRNSIGVCLQGNFQHQRPTSGQKARLRRLLEAKQTQYNIPKSEIYGHRDIIATLCPGEHLYEWLQGYKSGGV